MRILVTGGAGYIGSVTVDLLIKAGERVSIFDNLSNGHRAAVNQAAEWFQGDLASRNDIDAAMRQFKPEAVMHFAANSLVGQSMHEPFMYVGENVRNGISLLESAVAHGVKRFILSSTATLFGKPHTIPIDEEEAVLPGSPYGESKRILERVLHWLDYTRHLHYATLRYFNAAGATETLGEDHAPETHLIPVVLKVALNQIESITVFGDDYNTLDGTCVRDYIHVLDLAQAHILALRAIDSQSRTYNLGNGRGFTVKQVIQTAREVTGHDIPVVIGKRRPGDVATLVASSERIRRELGWKPVFSDLKVIIESAWKWHGAHPAGYAAQ